MPPLKRKRNKQAAYLILVILFTLSGLMTLALAGLTRSMTELVASNRFVNLNQAFQLAEAGLDAVWVELSSGDGDFLAEEGWGMGVECGGLTSCRAKTITLSAEQSATVRIADIFAPELDIRTTGISFGIERRISAKIRRALPTAFSYSVVGSTLNLNGGARIGSSSEPAKLYIEESPVRGLAALTTDSNNAIWASKIDFVNPNRLRLLGLCPNCGNAGAVFVFRRLDSYDLMARKVPDIQIDLGPYYQEARGKAPRWYEAGGVRVNLHHLTQDAELDSVILNGVMYVECGINVWFRGESVINGTIVHEGCAGNIGIRNHGLLRIDSAADLQFPYRGQAIVGAPGLQWGNLTSIDVRGAVMANARHSTIMTSGTIQGGFIGIDPPDNSTLRENVGPGEAGLVTWGPLADVVLGGTTTIIFQPLNIGTGGNSFKPELRFWKSD